MCECKSSWMHVVVKVLIIIGGINWGLIGLGMLLGSGDWNVVHMILGSVPVVEGIVYLLVGIAAVTKLFYHKCKDCSVKGAPSMDNSGQGM